MLTGQEISHFLETGYVKLERVFTPELAAEGRRILWKDTGCDPADPSTWTKAVIRLGDDGQEPFRKAANMPVLHEAFDQLVGKGKWLPGNSLGTFPVRFPGTANPSDTGWHAEASFYGEDGSMRLNIHSKGRALLMLFLFSDVGVKDAPTRLLSGSHLDIPPLLAPYGEKGLSFLELSSKLGDTLQRKVVLATGSAGTIYLCHPFLVHAAQRHEGDTPRFMAQPPLLPSASFETKQKEKDCSPVRLAIARGLGTDCEK